MAHLDVAGSATLIEQALRDNGDKPGFEGM
jgi:hypothetical protein